MSTKDILSDFEKNINIELIELEEFRLNYRKIKNDAELLKKSKLDVSKIDSLLLKLDKEISAFNNSPIVFQCKSDSKNETKDESTVNVDIDNKVDTEDTTVVANDNSKTDVVDEPSVTATSDVKTEVVNDASVIADSDTKTDVANEPSVTVNNDSKSEVNYDTKTNTSKVDFEDDITMNNDVLLISEKNQTVLFPYSSENIQKYLDSGRYRDIEDVVCKRYTLPLSRFKYPTFSRFKEAYRLIAKKEKGSFSQAFDLAVELMFNSKLHPAIIHACNSLNELDLFLDCLETNTLSEFPCFKVKFEVTPMLV